MGKLLLVATPIGNLGEFSPRAIETLKSADQIFCENTHAALRLMTHFGITGKTVRALHEANEGAFCERVAQDIAHGANIAYMSEAGVPCVSDPGFRLVRECRGKGLPVEAIGVPSAFLNALVISGLPTDQFTFVGFPPPKSVGRQNFFKAHCFTEATVIFYESCHRLGASLNDLQAVIGSDRWVCLCGELTKLHESSITASMGALRPPAAPKGEWVIVVAKEGYSI